MSCRGTLSDRGGVLERGQRFVRGSIAQPRESVVRWLVVTGKKLLHAKHKPGVAIVVVGLKMRFEVSNLLEEILGFTVKRLNIGCFEQPTRSRRGSHRVAEMACRLGIVAASDSNLSKPNMWEWSVGICLDS